MTSKSQRWVVFGVTTSLTALIGLGILTVEASVARAALARSELGRLYKKSQADNLPAGNWSSYSHDLPHHKPWLSTGP